MTAIARKPKQAPTQPPPRDLLDREPPRDNQAERSLLGGLLLVPESFDDIAGWLAVDDFYDEAHRLIYGQMMKLYQASRRFDVTIIATVLTKAGDIERAGGLAYLGELGQCVPHAAHNVEYAKIIAERAASREAIRASVETIRMAYDGADGEEVVTHWEQAAFALRDRRTSSTEHVSDVGDVLHRAMAEIDARMAGKTTGQSTGFYDLDDFFCFKPGQLVILAARPGTGKSALALNFAKNVSMFGPVLFVTLEMSELELADRLLADVAETDGRRMVNGTLGNEERLKILEATGYIRENYQLIFDDSPSRNVIQIAATARKTKRRYKGLALIVVDYLQLVEPVDHRMPREQQVALISKRLKAIARELQCPVLCLSQLNRQIEQSSNNKPKLSHLRESGAIEQDADVVMFVHREELFANNDQEKERLKGQAEIIVEKHRGGITSTARVVWQPQYTRFVNAQKHLANNTHDFTPRSEGDDDDSGTI
jgi:replicative DNA helicase